MTSGGGSTDMTAEQLASALGSGFLRNAIREERVTCSVCTREVDGFPRCWRCNDDRARASASMHRQADLVVPLAYGVDGVQSGHMMRNYKWRQGAVVLSRRQLAFRLWAALTMHRRCIEFTVGTPLTAWATVPSSSERTGPHPLVAVATAASPPGDLIGLVPGSKFIPESRAFEPERWALAEPGAAAWHHVLLIDDTWTTGARVQSGAMALAADGATAVTVVVLARWLDPSYAETAAFVNERVSRQPDYDPRICPVTGGTCP